MLYVCTYGRASSSKWNIKRLYYTNIHQSRPKEEEEEEGWDRATEAASLKCLSVSNAAQIRFGSVSYPLARGVLFRRRLLSPSSHPSIPPVIIQWKNAHLKQRAATPWWWYPPHPKLLFFFLFLSFSFTTLYCAACGVSILPTPHHIFLMPSSLSRCLTQSHCNDISLFPMIVTRGCPSPSIRSQDYVCMRQRGADLITACSASLASHHLLALSFQFPSPALEPFLFLWRNVY